MESTLPAPFAIRTVPRITVNPARAVVLAILTGYALAAVIAVATHWHFQDAGAYWLAAIRLREGEPLYFQVAADPWHPTIYRYAPWFAFAWIPLTYLPHEVVMVGWAGVQFAALGYLLWPARSWAAVALSLLLLPDAIRIVSLGNVQVPMLAVLLYALRSDKPWLVGVAASLKVFPILLALRWGLRGSVIAAGAAFVLVLPMLVFDLAAYPVRELASPLPLPLMGVVAISALLLAWRLPKYRMLGLVLAVMFSTPSWTPGMTGYLLLARPTAAMRTQANTVRSTGG